MGRRGNRFLSACRDERARHTAPMTSVELKECQTLGAHIEGVVEKPSLRQKLIFLSDQ